MTDSNQPESIVQPLGDIITKVCTRQNWPLMSYMWEVWKTKLNVDGIVNAVPEVPEQTYRRR